MYTIFKAQGPLILSISLDLQNATSQVSGFIRVIFYWLNANKMVRFLPFFPKRYGGPRGDGQQVLNGIIFINGTGLRERDAS